MSKIMTILKYALSIFSYFIKKKQEKKERKEEGCSAVQEGIKNEDVSQITAGFDDINNA